MQLASLCIPTTIADLVCALVDVIGDFTEAQSKEYISKIPINESNEPIHMVHVDYGLDDERSGIDIEQYLKHMMQNNS